MRRVEKYPFQAAVVWAKERIEDAHIAEGIIGLGCVERIEAFGVIWSTTEDEKLAEREAIKYMLLRRKDLKDMQSKMHDPMRIYARGELNEELVRLSRIGESFVNYLTRKKPRR